MTKDTVPKGGVAEIRSALQDKEEEATPANPTAPEMEEETGGVSGPEPTRYGDWERKGRCYDF
jgi:hypothetical protein